MAKKQAGPDPQTGADLVTLRYIGPRDAESSRYGSLVPGRSYPESDPEFAAYLVATHPDHWELAAE